jgi:glutathione S-transferase
MSEKPILTYFDAPMSRGEECRLALHIGGVEFEDRRIARDTWPALKPKTPFGSLPLLELPGRPVLAQSNAILTYIGRRYGVLPKDELEAARHLAVMSYVEELRAQISPTLHMTDEAEKKRARENLASAVIPAWGANLEKQIGEGPFFGGAAISVADLKIHMVVRWLNGGALDHVPTTVLADYPKLNRIHDAVGAHERVKHWRSITNQTG